MKAIATILCVLSPVFFTACSKSNEIPTVSGTINGVPALTLYGSSGKPTDYVLLSMTTDKQISYQGNVYSYSNITSSNDIFITISTIYLVKGTLTTANSKTQLVIVTSPQTTFGSTLYTSK